MIVEESAGNPKEVTTVSDIRRVTAYLHLDCSDFFRFLCDRSDQPGLVYLLAQCEK